MLASLVKEGSKAKEETSNQPPNQRQKEAQEGQEVQEALDNLNPNLMTSNGSVGKCQVLQIVKLSTI